MLLGLCSCCLFLRSRCHTDVAMNTELPNHNPQHRVSDRPECGAAEPQTDTHDRASPPSPTTGKPQCTDPAQLSAIHSSSRSSHGLNARRFASQTLTVIMLTILGGIAFWGHRTGWRFPKFSELVGDLPTPPVAWCEEHGVPEAECIACNADLMPKGKLYGWCKVHGVHECVLEHPELAQLDRPPLISFADLQRAAKALEVRPRPENDPGCKMHLRRIQFPSIEAADKAGIDIALVDRGPVTEAIRANGEVVYDPTRVARLASRAAGTVWLVEKNVGDQVRKGDLLALVDATEVGQAKTELAQAVVQYRFAVDTYDRLAGLGTVVAGKRLVEAETAVAESEARIQRCLQKLVNLGVPLTREQLQEFPTAELNRRLQFLGVPASVSAQLDPLRTTSNLLPVVAPRDGIVVYRDVVAGEVVDTTRTLFTVADTSAMWLLLDVPLEQMQYVSNGQEVVFQPDGTNQTFRGRIDWLSTEVDRETRTVQVRAELPNEDGHLRNETFGTGRIILREDAQAILVPRSAVHWEGCCHVAFVRDKNWFSSPYKIFHTRSVRPGVVMGDHTEIIAGLLPGEVVVTKGSDVLRAELLKGNLGPG
ncbi:MAG: hypothetical protein KatS3mg111_2234 [Pirellulaceae bacterium]|nr:MAG: hypothetical protein KatS3mg111_2234 [Pirellulaceae bacterium]